MPKPTTSSSRIGTFVRSPLAILLTTGLVIFTWIQGGFPLAAALLLSMLYVGVSSTLIEKRWPRHVNGLMAFNIVFIAGVSAAALSYVLQHNTFLRLLTILAIIALGVCFRTTILVTDQRRAFQGLGPSGEVMLIVAPLSCAIIGWFTWRTGASISLSVGTGIIAEIGIYVFAVWIANRNTARLRKGS